MLIIFTIYSNSNNVVAITYLNIVYSTNLYNINIHHELINKDKYRFLTMILNVI